MNLEAKSGWGEVETIETGTIKRRVVGLTAEEVGLTLAEGKTLFSEPGRLVVQTQMEDIRHAPVFVRTAGSSAGSVIAERALSRRFSERLRLPRHALVHAPA